MNFSNFPPFLGGGRESNFYFALLGGGNCTFVVGQSMSHPKSDNIKSNKNNETIRLNNS